MNITREELTKRLLELKGAQPISLVSLTEPKLLKKHRETKEPFPYPGILKMSKVLGFVNFRYENSVNKQREREGKESDFESQPRQWGLHIIDPNGKVTPLVEHKGNTYVEIKVQRSLESTYLYDGRVVPAELLKGYFPAQSSRQEVENPIILRDYALSSIRKITFRGQTYKVIQ